MRRRLHPFRPWFRAALATLGLLATSANAAVRDADDGLTVDRGQPAQRRGAETLHPVRVDRRRFEATGRGASLELPGTGNATQRARFERSVRRGGDFTWIGKVDTELGEQAVVITFGEDAVFGTIPQRSGPPLRVETRRGKKWLVEGEQRKLIHSGGRNDARIPRAGADAQTGTAPPSAAATTTSSGGYPVIDVLVAYTPSMTVSYGSTSAVLTRLTYLENLTNQAYIDTPAAVRIRVVARQALNYTTASANGTLLDLITDASTHPVKAQIDAWRQQYGADLVTVVRAFDTASQDDCGVGWIGGYHGMSFSPGYGYSVVSDGEDGNYYCTDQTFAHELGHNMGSHHDTETAGGDYGAYSYSRGYRRTLGTSSGFATVMAYSDGPQTTLNRFSNPALAACMTQACGNSGADNARSLGNAAAAVAAYRAATTSPPPPTPTTPSLSVGDASVVEGNSGTRALTFRVALSAAASTTVTFYVATTNGSAVGGSDFTALPSTRVSLAPGVTGTNVSINVLGDTTVEGNETFTLGLANATGATIADASATGTISNDDAATPAGKTLAVRDASVIEGNSGSRTAYFNVSLSSAATTTVAFDVSTANGTAAAGSDYTAIAPTRVSFAPGVTATNVPVVVLGDTTVEANETFTVRIANATGATIADASGTGTISNDDGTVAPAGPGLSVTDATSIEGDGGSVFLAFKVVLSKPSTATVTFDIATANGTAVAGADYSARSLTGQTIPAGTTSRSFNVIVLPDNVDETDETVFATLQAATGASIVDGQATGTIVDDD